jgi:hypothetical protein
MEKQLVLYLDNCVFSAMLDPNYANIRQTFANCQHRIAFSDVHLMEMNGEISKHAQLLEDLDAIFVRNPGEQTNLHHSICSLDFGEPRRRLSDHREFAPAYSAFESMLSPLQHWTGGRRERNLQDIASETGDAIKEAISELFSPFSSLLPEHVRSSLNEEADQTTEGLKLLDAENSSDWFLAQAQKARAGDPMRAMDPVERVEFLFSLLDPQEVRDIEAMFPRNFAQKRALHSGEMAAFASTLFVMGLTKRRGIFNGPRQEKKFAAQFRDALHIEEASRCDTFVTLDRGAFELAASSLAYAGFSTGVVLLRTN